MHAVFAGANRTLAALAPERLRIDGFPVTAHVIEPRPPGPALARLPSITLR